ncbi:hypothetical protein H4F33_03250 [Pectobacterium brasiliense]|uniref:hypothetical protein n=1 Tax=Pectobacterium brasiliense TaxID=180957 RepID=UPI00196963A2|nr:hypothetical protein [Pectobacterium brasiliense]MBN3071151.1 hypothetical protein [Pectobacterium brasiliense]MBN3167785.1 hypothetical protein [Pectobacterium brasiliense]
MSDLLPKIDNLIREASKDSIDLSMIPWDELVLIVKAITVDKDSYKEPVSGYIKEEHENECKRLLKDGKTDEAIKLFESNSVLDSPEDTKSFSAAILMYFQGQREIAQSLVDAVYASMLRKKYYPQAFNKAEENAYKSKLREVARKPRNPNYEEAMRIASSTWKKFPKASKGAMCVKLQDFFERKGRKVSIDTLDKWIKKSKIQPPKPDVYVNFSLVIEGGG